MLATPLSIAPPHVSAAPMTGVEFLSSPSPVLDTLSLAPTVPPGEIGLPLIRPSGITQALLQVTVVPDASVSSGVVMLHTCSVKANPLTDVIVPIQGGTGPVTNQAYVAVPGLGDGVCMDTTAPASRILVFEEAYVLSGSGAAYVDVPFSYVTTVVGPVTAEPIDLTPFGVPADADGVAVWLDALSSTNGFAILFPCGQPAPFRAHAIWTAGAPSTTLVAGVASKTGLCISISDGATVDISIDGAYLTGATPTATSPPQVRYTTQRAPGFVSTAPTRLFDTRTARIPIIGGQEYRLDLSPFVPIDTTAVVMNVTATEPTGSGFVTAYPCDGTRPDTSSLNFVAGQTVPNLVTVDAALQTDICFYASASTHLLADLAGYYVAADGDGFVPSPPVRMFDTRRTGRVVPGQVRDINLSNFVGNDASAVVFNLTATDVLGPGYVTAYPCGQDPPVASNLNVSAGQTVPNLVTVALSTNKHVCFFSTASTQLIADLAGWYAPSAKSGFVAIGQTRWTDTRALSASPLPAGNIDQVPFVDDIPDATAIVFNVTATETAAPGYLTAYPCTPVLPDTSNVNFVAGQTVPNMAITAVDANDEVCIFNSARSHWIVDVSGYFTETLEFLAYFPDGTDIT